MKKITVNQIENVLDEYLEKYKNNEFTFKNILFLGAPQIGKSAVIERWYKKNNKTLNEYSVYPTKDVKGNYEYNDAEIACLNTKNTFLHLCYFSSNSHEKMKPLVEILKDRNYNGNNLNNLFLFIAESVAPFDKNIMDLFDIYEVEQDVKEFKEYFVKHMKESIESAESEKSKQKYQKKLKLGEFILSSPKFKFIYDGTENNFSPLQFLELLRYSDGTKAGIISDIVLSSQGLLAPKMFVEILVDYKD